MKRILTLLFSLMLVAGSVAAQDITEVFAVQKDSATAVEYGAVQKDSYLSFLDFKLGSTTTLRSNQPLRGRNSQLSVVSVSGDKATLRFSSTLTVEEGQIIELSGQNYLVGREGESIILILAAAPRVQASTQSRLLGTTPTAAPRTNLFAKLTSLFR